MKTQLSQLFRNYRRRSEKLKPSQILLCAKPSESCFKEKKQSGEDTLSLERNYQTIANELKRRCPRLDLVKGLIEQTHQQRREMIETCVKPARAILNDHSLLKDHRCVRSKIKILLVAVPDKNEEKFRLQC